MAVSEETIQEALQAGFQAMSAFADADVVINNWDILDNSVENAPYVIIENADGFVSMQDTVIARNDFVIPFTLVVKLGADSWTTALLSFRDTRQAVIDAMNTGTLRTAGGQAGINIRRVRNDGPIGYIYPPYVTPEEAAESTPLFVSQRLVAECEEF